MLRILLDFSTSRCGFFLLFCPLSLSVLFPSLALSWYLFHKAPSFLCYLSAYIRTPTISLGAVEFHLQKSSSSVSKQGSLKRRCWEYHWGFKASALALLSEELKVSGLWFLKWQRTWDFIGNETQHTGVWQWDICERIKVPSVPFSFSLFSLLFACYFFMN